MAMGCGAVAAAPSPLARYVDHARVVVISAPAVTDPQLQRQDTALSRGAASGLRERDLVVLHAVGSDPPAQVLRRAVGLGPARFGVALVGKDGGVKLRSQHVVTAEALFSTIDAMPMRQAEMRSRGSR